MDVLWLWVVLLNCFLLSRGDESVSGESTTVDPNSGGENKTFEIELFPTKPLYAGQNRTPRKLFRKIQTGAAFLTGLKLGSVLSKKGFELGHGKIASSHSFQLFGKNVNSAMSLSYGDIAPLLPLVDDAPVTETTGDTKKLKKEEESVFHVTVIENPSAQTVERLQSLASEAVEEQQQKEEEEVGQDEVVEVTENVIRLFQESKAGKSDESSFLADHNKRVRELNEKVLRRTNSKF